MKVIGIDIDKIKAIFYVLEKSKYGKIKGVKTSLKFLTMTDDTDNKSIRAFQSSMHAFFDEIKADRIAILKRQTKGRFRSAPLSFKIEGLIQCYKKTNIEFFQPLTISNYFKKNDFDLEVEHDYQEPAAKLAYYILDTE